VNDASTNVAWSGTETTGASAYDTATLSPASVGQYSPQGTMTYRFYGNSTCAGIGTDAGGGVILNGVIPNSATESNLTAGSYSFKATFTPQDSNFSGSTSACEPFSVS
jgi:hypothetical protein